MHSPICSEIEHHQIFWRIRRENNPLRRCCIYFHKFLNAVKRNLFAICRESGRGNCQILELPKISSRLEEGGLRPGKWAIVAAVVLSGQLSVVLGFMWPVMRPCVSFSPILRCGWQLHIVSAEMAYGIREIRVSKSEKYMFQNQRNICLKNKQIYVAQVVATSGWQLVN